MQKSQINTSTFISLWPCNVEALFLCIPHNQSALISTMRSNIFPGPFHFSSYIPFLFSFCFPLSRLPPSPSFLSLPLPPLHPLLHTRGHMSLLGKLSPKVQWVLSLWSSHSSVLFNPSPAVRQVDRLTLSRQLGFETHLQKEPKYIFYYRFVGGRMKDDVTVKFITFISVQRSNSGWNFDTFVYNLTFIYNISCYETAYWWWWCRERCKENVWNKRCCYNSF